MTLQQMQQNYEDARSRATGLLERARTQARTEAREMSTSEKAYIDAALKEARSWRDRIDRARGDANMLTELDRITGSEGTSRSSTRGWRSRHAFGQQVVDSEMFQWLLKHRGQLPSGQWTSPSSELPSAFDLMGATISSDPSSGGDLILPDHRPGIVPLPMRPLTIADLMASGTTESNTVMYMKETSVVNAAAAVAEGAPKPESTIVFDAATDPVRKLATWIPITEEMLEDVPAMRAYLDTRLRYFVQLVEDDQLLNGDGTAPNISGILDRPGISAPIARTDREQRRCDPQADQRHRNRDTAPGRWHRDASGELGRGVALEGQRRPLRGGRRPLRLADAQNAVGSFRDGAGGGDRTHTSVKETGF